MAARPRKRPVIDRLRDARFALETTQGVQRIHAKVCVQCSRAGDQLARRCDSGWAAAKAEHRQQLAVDRLTTEAALESAQGTLW